MRGIERLQSPADGGVQQQAVVVVIVNARECRGCRLGKAELIAPFDPTERRDMQFLSATQHRVRTNGTAIRRTQQVAVVLAKRVVDLGQHRAQLAGRIVAIPERHGVKHPARNARKRLQPDLAIGG